MNFGSNPTTMRSAHRDILDTVIPDSIESKQRLLEECKNRAKAAVSGKAWPDAQMLYEKALEVVVDGDKENTTSSTNKKEIAILNSNLSLVHGKMGQFSDAQSKALIATETDPTYVKGWWRLGQAYSMMEQYVPALEAMEKAKSMEPTNKALIQECNKLKQLKNNKNKNGSSSNNKNKMTSTKTQTASSSSSNSKSKKNTTAKKKKEEEEEEEDEEKLFTKSDHVKGYKTTSDGKKTSYFHNELSEHDRQLIGDIAPKKLDTATTTTTTTTNHGTSSSAATTATNTASSSLSLSSSVVADPSTSAWNTAGTWEEKDVTQWAKEQLENILLRTQYVVVEEPPPSSSSSSSSVSSLWKSFISSTMMIQGNHAAIVASVSKVTIVNGHASMATVRGKKRYIYEFELQIEWNISFCDSTAANDDDNQEILVKGSMRFPDIDGTCELGKGYDMDQLTVQENHYRETIPSKTMILPTIQGKPSRGGETTNTTPTSLCACIHQSIDDWVRLFRQTY